MQKRAGILFVSKDKNRLFLKIEDSKWTVPTFFRSGTVLEDSQELISFFNIEKFKLFPVELYLSKDQGFEYSTYICMVDKEFIPNDNETFCWASLNELPKGLHNGLKVTLSSPVIKAKIDVIMVMGSEHDL